jgi:hypothetical protein
MSQLKYCQGPKCHTHDTKDRKRGPKDNKRNETRRRSSFYYLNGNACSMQCQAEWFDVYGSRALDHFGRITEAKVLTKDNAWAVRRNWNYNAASNTDSNYYAYNYLTDERRNITEQQYDNENTITPNGQLNI